MRIFSLHVVCLTSESNRSAKLPSGVDKEAASNLTITAENFGVAMDLLQLSGAPNTNGRESMPELIWLISQTRSAQLLAHATYMAPEKFSKAPSALRTQSELFALGRSFELMLAALGGDRDRAGDAIYGAKTTNLVAVKESSMGCVST